jgi:pimeloyl-ACP methyl ester carboxylesterase
LRKIFAVLAAVGLTTTAVTAATAPAVSAATKPARAGAIAWSTCSDQTLQAVGAVCGFVSVPLSYSDRGGAKIQLAVSMVRHTVPDSKYQGVMLVNPGGPGGSGLILSILGEFVPNHVGEAYDWIGFDPRGVGSSKPALTCRPNYFHGNRPDYIPTSQSLVNTWLERSKDYAQACAKKNGNLLNHMTTVDAARDMDSIRVALGADQINYYGFSYGTYLGQVYATLFPHKVRRMVLDSNVDPRRVWYQANLDQDVAFNRNIKIWFAWLAKYDSIYHLGKTESAVERLWYVQQNGLRSHPAGGVVGPDEWTDIFLGAGYYQQTWLDLGDAFSTWVHKHDVAAIVAAYHGAGGSGDDNGYAVYNAVQCTDVQWPTRWSKWRDDNWKTFFEAPFETWGNAWFNAPCLSWPAKAHQPLTINGSKIGGILLIDETLDAATPFSGSLEVRKLFPKASLLAEPGGTGHANSLRGNACVDDQIAAYLADGTLPHRKPGSGPDARCAPLPAPVPLPGPVPVPGSAAVKAPGAGASTSAPAVASAAVRAQLQRLMLAGRVRG